MAYPCLYSLVMCGNTFNMTEIKVKTWKLQIWIDHNAKRHHDFNMLLHALS